MSEHADDRFEPVELDRPEHERMGGGREFDGVREMLRRWGPLAHGIGDDGAVLDVPVGRRLVVSTDTSVENVHFRREWLDAREIAYRAATSALSDLAAMAADPLAMVVAMTLPDHWRGQLAALADGVGDAARAAEIAIVGGDTTRGEELTITVTVLGTVERELRRDGARAGDLVYVTGTLGGPQRALRAWLREGAPDGADRARFACPNARIREARWLADHGATSAVDLSDGLAADLAHVAAASGVLIRLDLDRVPCVAGATALDAVASGEEYEIIVTAPERAALDASVFRERFGLPLTEIGRVEHALAEGGRVEGHLRGNVVDLPGGHDHFTS